MGRGLIRSVGLALCLSLPGWLVLAGLVAWDRLDAAPAWAGAVMLLVLMVAAVAPATFSLAGLRSAIEALAPDGAAGAATPAPRLGPAGRMLWPAILRLRRAWAERGAAAEAGLAAAEAVTAAIPDPVILIDASRRIVRANPAAAEFVGTVSEPRELADALRNPALLAAADAVLRGEPARTVEFPLALPVHRVLQARFARLAGPARDGAAAVMMLHDITALKRAEQMRADFIANAGHELKTPLSALVGFIETLLGPARDDPAARERFLGIMREQAGRMARLVDDLLSLSRIELNEHVAPTERVALDGVIEEVAAALELRAAERGMRLSLSLPADLPEAVGDRDQLAQVFQNLLDNAIKYSRPNTEIAVSAAINTGAAGGTRTVTIAVIDQGDGIAREHLSRLTERFYRADTARSRELGGTGLGLAIVKHIVNRHRGRLDIASTLGEGSTFTVSLPAVE